MKRTTDILLTICMMPIMVFANNEPWQDFENNAYIGGAYSYNNANINQFGAISGSSPLFDLGGTMLLSSNLWANVNFDANFVAGGSYVSNWYNLSGKLGYSFTDTTYNFTPYAMIGLGNNGAYFSNANAINYGLGLLSEAMLDENWVLFADFNYQLQNFNSQINGDFNKNVLANYSTYTINNSPSIYGISLGAKYLSNNGFFISPFIKYQDYNQSFSVINNDINYGTVSPTTSQVILGINFGVSL